MYRGQVKPTLRSRSSPGLLVTSALHNSSTAVAHAGTVAHQSRTLWFWYLTATLLPTLREEAEQLHLGQVPESSRNVGGTPNRRLRQWRSSGTGPPLWRCRAIATA